MSSLESYCADVQDGRVTAGRLVKMECDRLMHDIQHPGRWHFDPALARRPVEFIERFCKTPTGKIGTPLVLEPFEKAWVEAIFGFVGDDGNRRFIEAFIEVARKNGKTTLAACIELYMLVADGEGAPQVYNLATSNDQSKLCYGAVKRIVAQSRALGRKVVPIDGGLSCPRNLGTVTPLSGRPASLDGLDPHLVVIDEMAAMRTRELYDLMAQAIGAREQPLMFEISSNGFVRGSIFDSQRALSEQVITGEVEDDRFLPLLYELDDPEEWHDPSAWAKANPGLGTVKKTDKLARNVERAENDPSFVPTVLTKDFDVPQNSVTAWLTYDEAVNHERFELADMGFRYCVVGFDAADTIDLTAAQALMMRPGDEHIYELSMYWIPEAVLEQAEAAGTHDRDMVPYRLWVSRGLMRTVPGNKVPKSVLVDWMAELRDEHDIYTFACGYDPWHVCEQDEIAVQDMVGRERAFRIRQGARTLSQPMKQIRADYQQNRFVDNDNPINNFCRMNVSIKVDANGNQTPYKKENLSRNRIDGFMAELDAYVVLCDLMEDYQSMI